MKLICIILVLSISELSFAQVYLSKKTYKNNACYLKINKDSTVNFVIEANNHGLYEEYVGQIKHSTDSLYQISAKVIYGHSIFENDRGEFSKFDVNVSSTFPFFDQIQNLTVKYYDGKIDTIQTQKGTFTTFYFDRKRFNTNHPFVNVYTKRLNPITKGLVYIRLFIRASIDFSLEDAISFKVVINKNHLRTIGEPPLESGSFTLKKVW